MNQNEKIYESKMTAIPMVERIHTLTWPGDSGPVVDSYNTWTRKVQTLRLFSATITERFLDDGNVAVSASARGHVLRKDGKRSEAHTTGQSADLDVEWSLVIAFLRWEQEAGRDVTVLRSE